MNVTAPYNLDLYNNATTLFQFANASNEIISGLFGIVILFLAFIIPFIVMKNFDTKAVFLVSSATCTIIGIILMTPLQWITLDIFWFPLLSLILAIILNWSARDDFLT